MDKGHRILIYGYVGKRFGGKVSGGISTYISSILGVLEFERVGIIAENVGFYRKAFENVVVYGPPSRKWFLREIAFSKTFKPSSIWLWDSRMGIVMNDIKPHVFYSHIPHSPANKPERLRRLKNIMAFHSLHAYEFEKDTRIKREIENNLRFSFEVADIIVYPSTKVKHQVENFMGFSKRSAVIPPLVKAPQNFNFDKYFSRRVLGLKEDETYVGFAGILTGRKGENILIKASEGEDWIVVIAGDGPNMKGAKELAKRLGVDVKFLGDLGEDRIWHFYNSLDVFCLPSRSETFGISVVEAMLMGRKVVVSEEVPYEVAPDGICIRTEVDVSSVKEGIHKALNTNIPAGKIVSYAKRFCDEKLFLEKHLEIFSQP